MSKVRIVHRYSREQIMADPHTLYVFGDNLERAGYGGQAAAARDCPNAVGIPTLHSPGVPAAPSDLDIFALPMMDAFQYLNLHLAFGRDVVWPADGVGTGIANLEGNCPDLLIAIEHRKMMMFSKYGTFTEEDGYPYRGFQIWFTRENGWCVGSLEHGTIARNGPSNELARQIVDEIIEEKNT